MVEQTCNRRCCKAIFCPLKPAWARTIHATQSLQAGPTTTKQKCDFLKLLGDPGSIDFEKITPGLLYSLIGRATTIGNLKGKRMDSALYFIGSNMSEERMTNLSKNKDGTKSKAILKRQLWIQYLDDMVNEWKTNNPQHFDNEEINKQTKQFHELKDVNIERTIIKYIQKLQIKEKQNENDEAQFQKWIRDHKQEVHKMKTTNETVKIVSEDKSDNKSDDEYAEENIDTLEEQNNTSDDKYLEDGLNTNEEHNNKIPDVLRQYEPIEIIDVNGNGSCGYYSIQEGLKKHMITFDEDMNNFRKKYL